MKKFLLLFFVALTGLIFLSRLVYLQVFSEELKLKSEMNAIKTVFDYPERGFIYDRNGELMVANQTAYDVMVVPREVKVFDTLELCRLLQMEKEDFVQQIAKAKHWSWRKPSVVIPQLTQLEYAPLQEKLRKFDGFYTQRRSLRKYLVDHSANALGYIREFNQGVINADDSYQMGDLIGKSGIEVQYERELRGKKGVKRFLRDNYGRPINSYEDGKFDTIPKAGANLTITLDSKLQQYGQQLMLNKRGGIVAIEPKTGEILSLISAPQ